MSANPLFAGLPLLDSTNWKVSYRHEDGNLVDLFYNPALACSVQYDRMTGYFSASALALAARGLNGLMTNQGRMRLIVGCTLEEPEVKAIAAGYDLRACVEKQLMSAPLEPPGRDARRALEHLASMVASGFLDVKVAVPVDNQGNPVFGNGIYHEKVGILTDAAGSQLAFTGSINETANGWLFNRESFQVSCSWCGGRDVERVQSEVKAFARFWEDRSTSVKVFDFPEAAKARLLEFLPKNERQPLAAPPVCKPEAVTAILPVLSVEERRRITWSFVRYAAALSNGLRVGEETAAVSSWPHQLGTFAKFIQNWPSRMLVADEVGLGKTITTGLILRQAWLSGLAKRILVLAPAGLLIQWQNELYEKFNLNVPIYNGKELVWRRLHADEEPREQTVSQGEWHKQPFVLASSHLVRRKDRQPELLAAANWDLLVLDEAHHARRKGGDGPYRPNTLLSLMDELKAKTASLLLLTATPMQVHPIEVWDLLALLGLPDEWNDAGNFLRYFEQVSRGNPGETEFEFLAGMFRVTERHYGGLKNEQIQRMLLQGTHALTVSKILKSLRDDKSKILRKRLSADERKLALIVMQRVTPLRHLMARQTRNLLREYHRTGQLTSPIAVRDPRDIAIDLTAEERSLYEAVEEYIAKTYSKAALDKRSAVGFVMTIYRRRLASSFQALQRTLNGRLERLSMPQASQLRLTEEDLLVDEASDGEAMDTEDANKLASEADGTEEAAEIKALLKRIAQLPTDSKALRLLAELKQAFTGDYDSAIIFTQYSDTMDYLKDFLADRMPEKKIACYFGEGGLRRDSGGTWSKCRKEDIKRDLKAKKIEILVCTDAAGEGLNLQFCGVLVNYDLPWNPMKVEQRIGRIDRIGQLYPRIRIYNLAYQDTVEADVYFKVGQRINLFQGIVGKLQPILSRLPKKLEEYTLRTTADKEEARHRLMNELEDLEREANEPGFDIDASAAASVEAPKLPEAALTANDIDRLVNHKELLPPTVAWRPLDAGSYGVLLPGMATEVRATTSGEVFSYCSDSQVLFSPGGGLFEDVLNLAAPVSVDYGRGGVCWLVKDNGKTKLLVATHHGIRSIGSYQELEQALEEVTFPQELGEETEVIERIV